MDKRDYNSSAFNFKDDHESTVKIQRQHSQVHTNYPEYTARR